MLTVIFFCLITVSGELTDSDYGDDYWWWISISWWPHLIQRNITGFVPIFSGMSMILSAILMGKTAITKCLLGLVKENKPGNT